MLPPGLPRPLVVGVSLVCVLVLGLATLRPTAEEEEGLGTRRAVTRRLQSITQYFDTYSHIINLDTFISLSFTQGIIHWYCIFVCSSLMCQVFLLSTMRTRKLSQL